MPAVLEYCGNPHCDNPQNTNLCCDWIRPRLCVMCCDQAHLREHDPEAFSCVNDVSHGPVCPCRRQRDLCPECCAMVHGESLTDTQLSQETNPQPAGIFFERINQLPTTPLPPISTGASVPRTLDHPSCVNCGVDRTEGNHCGIPQECGNCEDCCNGHCTIDGCNSPASCGSCECCEYCCDCAQNDRDIFTEAQPLKFIDSRIVPDTPVLMVAPEIEIASLNKQRAGKLLTTIREYGGQIVPDGSCYAEINTVPSRGIAARDQFEAICSALKAADAEVSTACGLHVHVDSRDIPVYQLQNILRAWAVTEEAWFAAQPRGRRTGHYSQPMIGWLTDQGFLRTKSPHAFRTALLTYVYGSAAQSAYGRNNKYHSSRYNALNIHSYFFRRTLEFRLHAGTMNKTKILGFATMASLFTQKTAAMPLKDIPDTPMTAPDGRDWLIENVLKGNPKTIEVFKTRFDLYHRTVQPAQPRADFES